MSSKYTSIETSTSGWKMTFTELSQDTMAIYMDGYIDTYNSKFIQSNCNKFFELGIRNLIINCNNLNYVSSTGIGCFLDWLKNARFQKGSIILVAVQTKVNEVFQLLGFNTYFSRANSVDEAINKISSGEVTHETGTKIFPKNVQCPFCNKVLKAPKAGRFRCPKCKEIFTVTNTAEVTL